MANLKTRFLAVTKLVEELEQTVQQEAEAISRLKPQIEVNKKIRADIDHFFKLRDKSFVERIFRQHADLSTPTRAISQARLGDAIAAVGLQLNEENTEVASKAGDLDSNGGIDLNEFRKVVETPTLVEEWVSMLPLAALLGRCLSFKGGKDSLKQVANLTAEERRAVVQEFSGGLERLLYKALDELKELNNIQAEMRESTASSKFQTTFKMSAGNIDNFHEGLAGRVGAPHPELDKGMRQEHCEKVGCDVMFETSNYGVRTTPRKEYEITVDGKECPEADMKDKHGNAVRVLRKIEEFKKLKMVEKAGLRSSEIIAVVLYTGPMFQIYNTILRQFPCQEFQRFKEGDNLFSTTIHVLVSAVIKISRTQRVPSGLELCRGLGGLMDLPDGFYRSDERGCRGCMEWGFLSTTSDKYAAMEYCGLKEGRPLPTLLRMTSSSADRPACIYELSQYPGEREYLFVPCSFLEPLLHGSRALELVRNADGTVIGLVQIVTVRINANLKGQTVEELEGRKKALHLSSFRYGIEEAGRELDRIAAEGDLPARLGQDPNKVFPQDQWVELGGRLESLLPGMSDGENITFTAEGFKAYLVREARAVLARHSSISNEHYASGAAYRRVTDESLYTLQACTAGLTRFLDDSNAQAGTMMRESLMDGLRAYHSHLWRQALAAGDGSAERAEAAKRLCMSMDLMETSAEELDSDGLTPLMRAAVEGEGPRALRCLVWAGAQINRQDAVNRRSALYSAASFGQAHAVEELARLGADINLTCEPGFEGTPIWIAAEGGHLEVVEALGRLGADVNRPVLDGRTPVYAAADGAHVEVVRALHRLKADVNTAETTYGFSPVFAVARAGHVEMVRTLSSLKADVNMPSYKGMTPLVVATRRGHTEVAEALRGMGAV